ncbi:MAG: putative esterase, partial [Clostridiales bacterium]|nr:putative esterase [Clostridiales bacterium]
TYDSGLIRSDLNANYIVLNPEILEIKKDGTLVPKSPGKTEVIYSNNNISTSKVINVDADLVSTVKISFIVEVPDDTPEDARVGCDTYSPIHLELHRDSSNRYIGSYRVKRGLNVNYKIRGFIDGQFLTEQDASNKSIPYRNLHAVKDEAIHCKVLNWGN